MELPQDFVLLLLLLLLLLLPLSWGALWNSDLYFKKKEQSVSKNQEQPPLVGSIYEHHDICRISDAGLYVRGQLLQLREHFNCTLVGLVCNTISFY